MTVVRCWIRVSLGALAVAVAAGALGGTGCGSVTATAIDSGPGQSKDLNGGSGGAEASGGNGGSAGSDGSGGDNSMGGGSGSGGVVGSGGRSGSGGRPGSGGAVGSGGHPASGGANGSGGTSGSGGATVDAPPADAPSDGPCACPDISSPVCGVNDKTYGNKCEADCAGVAVKHAGACCTSDADCLLYPGAGNNCCGVCQERSDPKPPMVQCLLACRVPVVSCACVQGSCLGGTKATNASSSF